MEENNHTSDHDRLIKIETLLGRVISDLADLKNNTVTRINILEKDKLNISEFEKYCEKDALHFEQLENDIDTLKNWRWYILGIGSSVLLVLEYVFRIINK